MNKGGQHFFRSRSLEEVFAAVTYTAQFEGRDYMYPRKAIWSEPFFLHFISLCEKNRPNTRADVHKRLYPFGCILNEGWKEHRKKHFVITMLHGDLVWEQAYLPAGNQTPGQNPVIL